MLSSRFRVDMNDCPKVGCLGVDGESVEVDADVDEDATNDGSASAGVGIGISGARAEFMMRME